MESSQLLQFIEKVKSDEALGRKVFYAEAAAATAAETIANIAAEAGYDITGSRGLPEGYAPTPTEGEFAEDGCWLTCGWVGETCCWVFTSTHIAKRSQV